MSDPVLGVVIPVGPGRDENLTAVLTCLTASVVKPELVVVVEDGQAIGGRIAVDAPWRERIVQVRTDKHEPGMEQPRNVGVRILREAAPDATHVWFIDSDVVFEPDCLEEHLEALEQGPKQRILVGPYDWLQKGRRPTPGTEFPLDYLVFENDPRWPMFHAYEPDHVFRGDLSAGLACFSGNLVWPIDEFERVGGFWSEIHHGRCEDGELGLRAVAMGVPISMSPHARGWHLWHPVNLAAAVRRNARDVPMLDARHPWVKGSDVFMVDRDGKAFDVRCRGCGTAVPTIEWWLHAKQCGVAPAIPVASTEGGATCPGGSTS